MSESWQQAWAITWTSLPGILFAYTMAFLWARHLYKPKAPKKPKAARPFSPRFDHRTLGDEQCALDTIAKHEKELDEQWRHEQQQKELDKAWHKMQVRINPEDPKWGRRLTPEEVKHYGTEALKTLEKNMSSSTPFIDQVAQARSRQRAHSATPQQYLLLLEEIEQLPRSLRPVVVSTMRDGMYTVEITLSPTDNWQALMVAPK